MFNRFVKMLSIYALLTISLVLTGTTTATAEPQPGKTMVGSWVVTINSDFGPPAVDITTVNRDGTMSNSDALFGTGHGVWRHAGASTFAFKFMTPILVTAGFPPGAMLTVTGTATVNDGGHDATGPFEAVVTIPPGNVFFGFSGTVDFARISID
jgi:hypothetical protein